MREFYKSDKNNTKQLKKDKEKPETDDKKCPSWLLIVCIIVASVAGLALFIMLVIHLWKSRSKNKSDSGTDGATSSSKSDSVIEDAIS